jgi:hypothetical protein
LSLVGIVGTLPRAIEQVMDLLDRGIMNVGP